MKKAICFLIIISLGIQGGNSVDARTKLLTDAEYSPTIAASEESIRTQVDDSIQEVYDIVDEAKLDKTGNLLGTWQGLQPTQAEPGLSAKVNAHLADDVQVTNEGQTEPPHGLSKNNVDATVDPIATNDSSEGYSVNSIWINTTDDKAFICVDATQGAAVWKNISDASVLDSVIKKLVTTDFPNLVTKLKAETKDIAALFVGDSGTWGQAATNYTAAGSDPELAPFTDGNSFADKVSNKLLEQLNIGALQSTISVDGEDTYNQTIVAAGGYTETGTSWAGTVRAECLGGLYRTGKVNGDYAVFTPPNNVDYDRADIYFVKAVNAGKFKIFFKRAADADWVLPSNIVGCTRSDAATGTDMDTVDAYYSTSTFQNIISYNLPSIDDWSVKLAVGDTKNASSSNYWIHLEGLRAYVVNSYTETGASWVETIAAEALDGLYRTGKTAGDYAVFAASGNTRKIQLFYTKSADAGIFKVYLKRASDADWILPSAITNCRRTDNAVGVAMNTVDAYAAAISYQNTVTYILPSNEDWSIKVEVGNTKNALSSNYWLNLEGIKRSKSHSYNWGKGAHNTNEYRGIGHAVNHLKEVVNYSPSLVILQPMVINDFVDDIALTVMISNVKQMIKDLRTVNCDVVMILPPPIATTSTPWDYADGEVLDDTAKAWKYHEGIEAMRGVARQLVVPLVDTYKYLEDEYNSVNHQYWFQANSRTHTNQWGHDLFAEAIIKNFPLF
jgi:hypothetical protein